MEQQTTTGPVLELIPQELLTPEQMAFRAVIIEEELFIYRFTREPTSLDEIDWDYFFGWDTDPQVAFWWEKEETLIAFKIKKYAERRVSFTLCDVGEEHDLSCSIYGKNDTAIAATATFFWSLTHNGESNPRAALRIKNGFELDSAAFSAVQLTRILDSNPTRKLTCRANMWNAQQSVILATRPYPLKVSLYGKELAFSDGGTAFVDALQTRQSSFGSLLLSCSTASMPLSRANLERLLELDNMFEKLNISYMKGEMALLPFSANVKALVYEVNSKTTKPDDVGSLDIVTSDLTLTIRLGNPRNREALPVAFLNRVAELGHFERLDLWMDHQNRRENPDEVASMAVALIRVIHANPQLTCLDLSRGCGLFDSHLQDIFEAMEDHPSLRTFRVEIYTANNFDYSWLEKLLSRNRNIAVVDRNDWKYSNGPRIGAIYSLNRFYHGSEALVKEPDSFRPQLVTTALTERASANFQYTALLLSNHTDVLCELVHGLDLDNNMTEKTMSPVSIPTRPVNALKRKTRVQPSRVAKKAAAHTISA